LAQDAQGAAAPRSAKGVYLRSDLASKISNLHVDKRKKILRGGVVDERQKLEAARVEVRYRRDLAADVDLSNNFLICIVADGAEVVTAEAMVSKCG
jgi:hypothetical protein